MRVVRNALLVILAFVLQTTWVPAAGIAGMLPDLVLLVLVAIALGSGAVEATLVGFGIGFVQDVYMPADLGLNALANSLVSFAVGYGRSRIEADTLPVQMALVFAAVAVHDLIFYLGSSGTSLSGVPVLWIRYSLGRALYTSVVGGILASGLVTWRRAFSI